MIPIANMAKANCPAMGRNASAACCDVSISRMPFAWSVAAVANTIARLTIVLKAMPVSVSIRMRLSSEPALRGVIQRA